MPKIKLIKKSKLIRVFLFIISLAIVISVPIMAAVSKSKAESKEDVTVLSLWQIDGFEGGKGSRAAYLQNVAVSFSKKVKCYITVTAITAEAARLNLQNGTLPDMISYGAGMYGLESYICGGKAYQTWCHGGYCYLSLDTTANFEDVSAENLIINVGTGNFADIAAILCGVNGASKANPTGAYVELLNGKYKYLLGTQRDIFRLKTRGAEFKISPITQFNDLYQNISVTSKDSKKQSIATKFINHLISESNNINKLGLMYTGKNLYDDEIREMENLSYESKLTSPISESMKKELEQAVLNSDLKKLKNLLN